MKHQELVEKLTLKEKAALLSGKDVWHTRAIERLGIPSMTLSDGPSGLRKQAGDSDQLGLNASTKATCIPSAAALANSWDPETARAMGACVGADAVAQKVDILLGPGLNTKRSPLCGRSFEYYSEDPYLAGRMAAGFIQGVQSQGVSACAKHFAANSQELLRMHSDSVMDERTLRELYLTNFEIAVKEGKPRCIMTSYNRLNGAYTNENEHLLKEILRGEWGYGGMVVTDWGGSNDFTEGVRAGMNLEMPSAGDDSPCQLVKAVQEGRIDEETVNRRVDELLSAILFPKPDNPVADPKAQHEAVQEAAEKSIVLLKNEGNALPVHPAARVAVIGDFAAHTRYQGAGSSMVNPVEVEEALPMMKDYFPEYIGCAQGFERSDRPNDGLADDAALLARKADVVLLYLGLPEGFETEGLDRTHMRLSDNQVNLINKLYPVNQNIIVVLAAGCAVEMPWIGKCKALVYGCLGGEAAATAMLRVLSGQVNPGGKLAETFALTYDSIPVSKYFPGREYTSEYREGLYVGYRYFATAKEPVRFPFGYGLSYTQFAYDHLTVTKDGVEFDVANIGKVDGDEIAQLYVRLPDAKIFRPERELKGFLRVRLAAGEKKRVFIPFDDYTFRYFNVKTNRFEIEGGTYDILVGASSQDIRLQGAIEIEGTGAPDPYPDQAIASYRFGAVKDVSDAEFEALLGRPVPQKLWNRGKPLEMNDALAQMAYAKNPVMRLAVKILKGKIDKEILNGKPNLNTLFVYNLPFRGMAKVTGGRLSMQMADDIRFMANGHWHRGLFRLIRHFFNRPKLGLSQVK
ncbi:MAG: glycoside hydrolase family 3 C-terminal domain-containing protein [Clostridia bacterium]|nr:glycoside hydrolase family 3 C-terminal domain-containing protein [Clostridia bacterium]